MVTLTRYEAAVLREARDMPGVSADPLTPTMQALVDGGAAEVHEVVYYEADGETPQAWPDLVFVPTAHGLRLLANPGMIYG